MKRGLPILLLVAILLVSGCVQEQDNTEINVSSYIVNYNIETESSDGAQTYTSIAKKYGDLFREDIYSGEDVIKSVISNDFGVFDCIYTESRPLCFFISDGTPLEIPDISDMWENSGIVNKQTYNKNFDLNGIQLSCEKTEIDIDTSKITSENLQPIISSLNKYIKNIERNVTEESISLLNKIKTLRISKCINSKSGALLEYISYISYLENGSEKYTQESKLITNIILNPEILPFEFYTPEEAEIVL